MTTTYELNEQERQVIEAMRSNQALDKPETPSVQKNPHSSYSYEERIAHAVFANLALGDVFNVDMVRSIQLPYVIGVIDNAITGSLKELGATVDVKTLIHRSDWYEVQQVQLALLAAGEAR